MNYTALIATFPRLMSADTAADCVCTESMLGDLRKQWGLASSEEKLSSVTRYRLAGDGIGLDGWDLDHARSEMLTFCWPWSSEWCHPSADPIRNYAKAAALIAAEIDRLQRKQASSHE